MIEHFTIFIKKKSRQNLHAKRLEITDFYK